MLIFAIGDVHGSLEQLTRLLDECRRFAKRQPTTFVFLGDYIDRGPNSRGVIQTIMDMQAADLDRVIALAGNHEDFLHKPDQATDVTLWRANGGDATLASYNASSVAELPADHLAWIRQLPTHHDDRQRFFVHAGIRPGIPLDEQTREDLLWIREPFLSSTADHGRLIIHGHSPRRDGKPDVHPNRVNLDTAAVYGGKLTAAVFTDSERMPVEFLQTS
jgi:serine/threonine protein phosphatase 1